MKHQARRSALGPAAAATALALVGLTLAALLLAPKTLAQPGAKLTVDDDCTAYAFTPDSRRILYASRQISREKHVTVEHDDIWEVTLDGHKRRLVDGSKLVKSAVPYSYQVKAIRISPDGQRMAVQMNYRTLTPERAGKRREDEVTVSAKGGELTDLMDINGKEIEIEGTKNSVIPNSLEAVWLADGQTVAYITQANGALLYTLASVRPVSGVSGPLMKGHSYAAVAFSPANNAAVAIERKEDLSGPIQLVWIDLLKQTERPLATLDAFAGQLRVSPDGKMIAYYRDGNTIEVRSVADPTQVKKLEVPFGRYEWASDDAHLLLKRGVGDQSDQLFWIDVADGQYHSILDGLIYSGFALSPDGKWVAVTEPGRQVLKLFPLS